MESENLQFDEKPSEAERKSPGLFDKTKAEHKDTINLSPRNFLYLAVDFSTSPFSACAFLKYRLCLAF